MSIEELAVPRKGSIKIGPFGSQLRKDEMVDDGVKVYGQENLIMEDWTAGDRRISKSKYLSLRSCELVPGDVVVTMMGTVGRCAVFPENAEPGIMDSHLLRIQSNSTLIDRQYLRSVMVAEEVVGRQIVRLSHGTIMAGLSSSIVRRIRIPTPPVVAEQRLITGILHTLDDAIRRTDQVIGKLQHMKQGLLNDLFTYGVDEHGDLRPTPSEAGHLYKDSPLGRIPKAWRHATVREVSEKIADRDHTTPRYVSDGVLMASPMHFIDDEGIDFGRCPRISRRDHEQNCKKTDSRPDDVLIHRIGAGLGGVRLVRPDWPEFSILHSLALIRPSTRTVFPCFLLWALRTDGAGRQMGLGTQSIGVPDLGLEKIGSLLLPLPGLPEQLRISAVLSGLQREVEAERQSLQKLGSFKLGLLHDLLTGRVRVQIPAEASA